MEKTTCPGCGAPWNGKHCRSCGYEPFREEKRPRRVPSQNGKICRKNHPLLGFLILLALIAGMLPILRNWGWQLEAMEEHNRSVTQEAVVPDAELVTLYAGEALHVFTTEYDTQHLSDGLTLYIQNDTDQGLRFHVEALLIDGNPGDQELYCKADAKSTGRNWLRFDPGAESDEIHSVSFLLTAYDPAGSLLITTDRITLGRSTEPENPYF